MGLLPLLLVGFVFSLAALITLRFPPKSINAMYGYRTGKSMRSQENWDIAQRYSSRLMLKQGIAMLVIGVVFEFIPIPIEVGVILSVVLLLLSVVNLFVQTEKKLK